MRNCCGVHDVRSVQLMLQTLQVVAISFFKDDADLQEFLQADEVECGDVNVARAHDRIPLLKLL